MRRIAVGLSAIAVTALLVPTLGAQAGPGRASADRASATITRLTVTPATKKIAYGTGWQLTAKARSSTGVVTNVSTTTRWRTTKPGLARVSSKGLVRATRLKRSGFVTIRATYGGKGATARIAVSRARLSSLSGVPATATLAVGQALTLQPVGRFVGFSQALRPWATYSATPTGIVVVSGGKVKALTTGTAIVKTTFRGKTVSTRVTVTAPTSSTPTPTPTATPTPTPTSTPTSPPPPHPQLTLAKSAGPVVDTDANGHDAGDEITYNFALSNSGDVALTLQGVSDPVIGPITCTPTSLPVGAAASCDPVTHQLTQAQVDAGTITSTATASALAPGGAPVSATSSTATPLNAVSALTVTAAAAASVDGDGDSILDMGDVLPWTFTVTNTGGTTLSSVSVTPTLNGPATCPSGSVAPGASITCSAQHTVTLADVAAGSITNQATASATGPNGAVNAPGPAEVTTAFDRMGIALQHGQPNIVTYDELVATAKAKLAAHTNLGATLLPDQPMNWNPGSQVYAGKGIESFATGSQQVIVTSNKNYLGSGTGTASLGLAGTAPGSSTRMAYFSANPFISGGTAPPSSTMTTVTDPGMVAFDANLLSWLLGSVDLATSTADVALVNMRDGTTSGVEGSTRTWFATHAPSMVLNASQCNLPAGTCLSGADLIIVGGDDVGGDTTAIANQVKAAYDAGVPVFFMGDYWADNTADAIAAKFSMTVDDGLVYWDQRGLLNSTAADQYPNGQDAYQRLVAPMMSAVFDTPLAVSDYQACITYQMANTLNSRPFASCPDGTAAFQAYRTAVNAWRTMITNVDKTGVTWFVMPRNNDLDLYRALVLVADKLRTGAGPSLRPGDTAVAVDYPVPAPTDGAALTRAMFVDATTMTAWAGNQAAAKTGTLYCTRTKLIANTCTAPSWPHVGAHDVTLKATGGDEWQATGLDALPGSPLTVSLASDPGVAVYVRTFYQRSGGTRSAYVDGSNRSVYDRPQFVATDWVPVTTTPRQISSPYGGPLYVRIVGSAAALGTSVPLQFSNVGTHPTVLDMTDDAQIAAFSTAINEGAYYADLAGNGFQAHVPVPYIQRALTESSAQSSIGRSLLYSSHGGLGQFLLDFRDQFVFSIYRLAGLQIGTQPLIDTLDVDVATICQNLGFPCLDSSLNQRTQIQHVNYDLNAVCGSLCSGNPIDSSGPPITFGWGESHELGHNLQRPQLNVSWPNTGTNGSNPAAADSWSNYSNRSGEVSNNIFPYHTGWNFFRVAHPGWGLNPETDPALPDTGNLNRDVGGVDAFFIAQSIRSAQLKNGNLAGFDARCVSHTTDAVTTPTNIAIANAIWRNSGTYDDNPLRMSFYQQIPVMLRGKVMADGTTLTDGFGIWTLLYQASRGWSDAASSQAKWTPAAQATYGMGTFPWNGMDAVYGSGKTVNSMIGNDWMLIMLSKISGYDFRPFFQMHGVLYTTMADQQVTANAPVGGYASFNMTFPALGAQLPFKDMSNINSVDMTLPATAWPGAYESSPTTLDNAGFHPVTKCSLAP